MKRRLFAVASVLSFALCALTLWLWVRSYLWSDEIALNNNGAADTGEVTRSRRLYAESRRGSLMIGFIDTGGDLSWATPTGGWQLDTNPRGLPPIDYFRSEHWHGCNCWNGTSALHGITVHHLGIIFPSWMPPLFFGFGPALWLVRDHAQRRRQRRQRAWLCPTCGYNLTGNTSGACPECGTPVPKKKEPAA